MNPCNRITRENARRRPLASVLSATMLSMTLLAGMGNTVAHAALTLDRNAPIQIEADSAVIDEPSGSAVYRGRVVLQQGLLRLQAGELTVYIKDGKAVKAVASGTPVLLDQAPATATDEAIHAEARRITFLIDADRMLLDNQATLRQGERLFQGAHIDYDVVGRKVKASGGGSSRVMLVLPPTPAGGAKPPEATPPRTQSTLQPGGSAAKP